MSAFFDRLPANPPPVGAVTRIPGSSVGRCAVSCWVFFLFFLFFSPECQADISFKAEPVAMITIDDTGKPLSYPTNVFFDQATGELYLLNSAQKRLVVYDYNYNPLISVGQGRGITSPKGYYVDRMGVIYICQTGDGAKPARLTILNAAFLPLKEIVFAELPGGESFAADRVTLGIDGTMYLVSASDPRILVLDSSGNFKKWMTLVNGRIANPSPRPDAQDLPDISKNNVKNGEGDKPDGRITRRLLAGQGDADRQPTLSEEKTGNMPEGYSLSKSDTRPDGPGGFNWDAAIAASAASEAETAEGGGQEPPENRADKQQPPADDSGEDRQTRISGIYTDSRGNLYLLSEEDSKIYVHNRNEEFLFSVGTKGGAHGKLSRPQGLAVDEKKQCIYVVDYMRHSILVYDFKGKFLFEFGGRGTSPLWFNYPNSIAVGHNGSVIIADFFNQRVQVVNITF